MSKTNDLIIRTPIIASLALLAMLAMSTDARAESISFSLSGEMTTAGNWLIEVEKTGGPRIGRTVEGCTNAGADVSCETDPFEMWCPSSVVTGMDLITSVARVQMARVQSLRKCLIMSATPNGIIVNNR